MNSPAAARILVVTDSTTEAEHLLFLLTDHFSHVRSSTDPTREVSDFQEFAPQVVVLAYKDLKLSQRYCSALHGLAQSARLPAHRLVLLCSKDEVATAFDLCKKQYFDDYVLYWPAAQDGLRLAMSVWIASRELMATQAPGPRRDELITHVRQLGDLENTLKQGLAAGEAQIAAARDSLSQLERQIATSSDELQHRASRNGAAGSIDMNDRATFLRELERLKQEHIAHAQSASRQGLEPLSAWAQGLKQQVEPALDSTRALAQSVGQLRPVVLVVDDDEMIREILARSLDPKRYEVVFTFDGAQALRTLTRVRPDVILMDVNLPGVDGVALTQHLKSSPEFLNVPVVMMTGHSQRETLRVSLDAGASDFLVKPFTRETLRLKLDRALQQSAA